MNRLDFSRSFDVLLNSYAIKAGFGSTDNPTTIELDEHEKSVLLTKAQEDEVLSLYDGKNIYGESFEQTEELRRYLAGLVREARLSPVDMNSRTGVFDFTFDYTFDTETNRRSGLSLDSRFFILPKDLWFITYESVHLTNSKCEALSTREVYPVRQDEYHKLQKNPFRGANDRRALRLDVADNMVEIICRQDIDYYYVRYLHKLKPIVLTDFTDDGLTVNGVSRPTECEVHESLHQRILERAVMMALQSRGYKYNNENN